MNNKYKITIFVFMMIFILLVSISSISAVDNTTNCNITTEHNNHISKNIGNTTNKIKTVNHNNNTKSNNKSLKTSTKREYYISTTGLNTTDGKTPETAWTYTHAFDTMNTIEYNNSVLYIQEGTYDINNTITFNNSLLTMKIVGNGSVTLNGQNKTRCFNMQNGTTSIYNITFTNFTAENGGAIYSVSNNTKLIHNTFINNNAHIKGGSVFITGNNSIIINNTFINNTISDTTYNYSTQEIQGGAVYVAGLHSIISNNIFINNSILAISYNSYSITSNGGAICVIGSYTNISKNVFIKNSLKKRNSYYNIPMNFYGGAIYCEGYHNLFLENNIVNNSIISNINEELSSHRSYYLECYSVNNFGGAVYIKGNNYNISKNNFTSNNINSITLIYKRYGENISVSIFINNSGGAIYFRGNDFHLSENNFINNSVTKYVSVSNSYTNYDNIKINSFGGAINMIGINNTLLKNSFINNYLNRTITYNYDSSYEFIEHGGAIYNDHTPNSIISDNTFLYNQAIAGGAIYNLATRNNTIINNIFMYNNMTNDWTYINYFSIKYDTKVGGIIYNYEINNTEISNNSFISNNATYSIIYNNKSIGMLSFRNNNFIGNIANIDYLFGCESLYNYCCDNVSITNNNFLNNTALNNGIALVSNVHSPSILTNNTFTNNYGYTNLLSNSESQTILLNNTFSNNNLKNINGIIYNGASTVTFNNDKLINNTVINGTGVIYNVNSKINISNCIFTKNIINNSTGYVIENNRGTLSIINSSFYNNTDYKRDMLFNDMNNLTTYNNTFIGNYLSVHNTTIIDTPCVLENTDGFDITELGLGIRPIYNNTVTNGTVSVYINNELYDLVFNTRNGRTYIEIPYNKLELGQNTLKLYYTSADLSYQPILLFKNIIVVKKTNIQVNITETLNDEIFEINVVDVDGNSMNKGNINLIINNTKYNNSFELGDDNLIITIPKQNFNIGDNNIIIRYSGIEYNSSSYINKTVKIVIKTNTIIENISNSTPNISFIIKVTDQYNNSITTGTLITSIHNKNYTQINKITTNETQITLLKNNLNIGDNAIIFEYQPINSDYTISNNSTNIVIYKNTSILLNVNNSTDNYYLTINVNDEDNNTLNEGLLFININNKTYDNINLMNDTTTIIIPKSTFNIGLNKINIIYNSSSPYYNSSNITATIHNIKVTNIEIENITEINNNLVINLKIKDEDSNILNKGSVKIFINNQEYNQSFILTNSSLNIIIPKSNLNAGNNDIKIKYIPSDDNYYSSTNSTNISVIKNTITHVSLSNNTTTDVKLDILVLDEDGNPIDNGNIKVIINNNEYNQPVILTKGQVSLTLNKSLFKAGLNNIKVNYIPINDNYYSSNNKTTINVIKNTVTNVIISNNTSGITLNIVVYDEDKNTMNGFIKVFINNREYNQYVLSNSSSTIIIPKSYLVAGFNEVEVNFTPPDNNYYSSNNKTTVKIIKNINLATELANETNNIKIDVNVHDEDNNLVNNGNIKIVINNIDYSQFILTNSSSTIIIPKLNLTAGINNIEVIYIPVNYSYYSSSTNNITFYIVKYTTTTLKVAQNNSNIKLNATVFDENRNVMNGSIKVYINDEEYNQDYVLTNGSVSITLNKSLFKTGLNNIKVNYIPIDNNYYSSTNKTVINVIKNTYLTTILSNDTNNVKINITTCDENNNLINGSVKIFINNIEYNQSFILNNSNLAINIPKSYLVAGSNEIEVNFIPTSNSYYPSNNKTSINIIKYTTTSSVVSNNTTDVKLNVKVYDEDNNIVNKGNVKIFINNKEYNQSIILTNGFTSLTMNKTLFKAGNNDIEVIFIPDDNKYYSSSNKTTITVIKNTITNISVSNNTTDVKLDILVLDEDGNPIDNGNIKVLINNNEYNQPVILTKGQVSLTLNKSLFKAGLNNIKVNYIPINDNYYSSNNKTTINVIKNTVTNVIISNNTTVLMLNIVVYDEDRNIMNGIINVSINNREYNQYVLSNSSSTIIIPRSCLEIGDNDIEVNFTPLDNNYYSSTNKTTVNIIKNTITSISSYNNTTNIKRITIYDEDGNILKNGSFKIYINNIDYNQTFVLNSSHVLLKINNEVLNAGINIIEIKYTPISNNYYSSSNRTIITVFKNTVTNVQVSNNTRGINLNISVHDEDDNYMNDGYINIFINNEDYGTSFSLTKGNVSIILNKTLFKAGNNDIEIKYSPNEKYYYSSINKTTVTVIKNTNTNVQVSNNTATVKLDIVVYDEDMNIINKGNVKILVNNVRYKQSTISNNGSISIILNKKLFKAGLNDIEVIFTPINDNYNSSINKTTVTVIKNTNTNVRLSNNTTDVKLDIIVRDENGNTVDNGNIKVIINNNEYQSVILTKGQVSLTLNKSLFKAGLNNIEVDFISNDDNFYSSNNKTTITIFKNTVTNVQVSNHTLGIKLDVNVHDEDDNYMNNGYIYIFINNKDYGTSFSLTKGKLSIILDKTFFKAGNNDIEIDFNSNDYRYYSSFNRTTVNIFKNTYLTTTIKKYTNDIKINIQAYDEDNHIVNKGIVEVFINDYEYNLFEINNGYISITMNNSLFDAGNNNLTINFYPKNEYYHISNISKTIKIIKPTKISAYSNLEESDLFISFRVIDDTGKTVNDSGLVNITIDNTKYTMSLNDVWSYVRIPKQNLIAGLNKIYINYKSVNNNYYSSNYTLKQNINKKLIIVVNNIQSNEGMETLLNITDEYGDLVNNGRVNLTILNNNYTQLANIVNGKARITIPLDKLTNENNILSIRYTSTSNNYSASKITYYINGTQNGYVYYVAVNGSSSNDGRTPETPWTYTYAFNTIRDTAYNNSLIYILNGNYRINSTVSFNKDLTLKVVGNNAVLNGYNQNINCFNIQNGLISLEDITFTGFKNTPIINRALNTVIMGNTFLNNKGKNGGAISNYNVNNALINNNIFTNNTASYGGAIYNRGNNTVINNNVFTKNNVTISSGAIYNLGRNTRVTNNQFTNNTAKTLGGAINNWDTVNITITDNKFTGNTANYGGSIYYRGTTLILDNNTMTTNTARVSAGAVFIIGQNNNVTNNNFTSNNAKTGAAINNLGTNTKINNNTIKYNIANTTGGAINNWNAINATITNNTIHHNQAQYGAIYLRGVNNTIQSNSIYSNKATISGGAIFNIGENTTITDNTLRSNNAKSYGGAVNNWNAVNTKINNNNLTSNNASYGGAIYTRAANTAVTGNTITSNTATNGGAIFDMKHNTTTIKNNNIQNNPTQHGKETVYKS